jgi:hypothetical protein
MRSALIASCGRATTGVRKPVGGPAPGLVDAQPDVTLVARGAGGDVRQLVAGSLPTTLHGAFPLIIKCASEGRRYLGLEVLAKARITLIETTEEVTPDTNLKALST